MNPEAVRQLQAAAARQHGADLPHHLAQPFREIVLRSRSSTYICWSAYCLASPSDRPPAKSRDVPATPQPPSCNFIRYRMTRRPVDT
jgi:hypothetical protein